MIYGDVQSIDILPRLTNIVDVVLENGGGTFSAETLLPLNLTWGYYVGGKQREFGNEEQTFIPVDKFNAGDIIKFLNENRDAIENGGDLGLWVDNGLVYLDVSEWWATEFHALTEGIMRDQISIWDIAAKAEILCPKGQ